MCLLWFCMCLFPIRELCHFLFQKLVSCSLWCLSVILQVHWHCNEPLSSLFCTLWLLGTKICQFDQYLESAEIETSHWGSPQKARPQRYIPLFPSPNREAVSSAFPPLILSYVSLGRRADMAETVFLTYFNIAIFAFEFACVWQHPNWFLESSIKAFGTV